MTAPMLDLAGSVRLHEFWQSVKARLNGDAQLQRILQAHGSNAVKARTYYVTDNYSQPEGDLTKPWGRLVIQPPVRLWAIAEDPLAFRAVQFQVRAEFNAVQIANYDVTRSLDAAHVRVYELLQFWTPAGGTEFTMAQHVYRFSPPSLMPFHDQQRNVWFSTAEYRTEVAPGVVPVASMDLLPATLDLRL